MGEKSGGMTNMILIIIALVALIFVVNASFPEFATTITEKMRNIIDNEAPYSTTGSIAPPSTFL